MCHFLKPIFSRFFVLRCKTNGHFPLQVWFYVAWHRPGFGGWHRPLQTSCPVQVSSLGPSEGAVGVLASPPCSRGNPAGCLSPSRWLLLLGRGCFQGMWVQIAPWGFASGCASVSLFCCLRKPLCSFPSEPVRVGAMLGCVLPARRGRRLQSCSFPVPF